MFKKILWRISTRLRRLFGKNARTVWISHPIFLQHLPGPNHPDRPERISAIQTALKQEGIWRRLQTTEAPEIKDAQLALVHSRNYLHELEAAQPLPGKSTASMTIRSSATTPFRQPVLQPEPLSKQSIW